MSDKAYLAALERVGQLKHQRDMLREALEWAIGTYGPNGEYENLEYGSDIHEFKGRARAALARADLPSTMRNNHLKLREALEGIVDWCQLPDESEEMMKARAALKDEARASIGRSYAAKTRAEEAELAAIQELDEVKSERDHWEKQSHQLKAENDELAQHVEALREELATQRGQATHNRHLFEDEAEKHRQAHALANALAATIAELQGLVNDDPGFCEHLGVDLVKSLSSVDTTSINRLKAKWRKEREEES